MPTVVVEAGAAGCPVAAAPVGGVLELLGDGRGLLFRVDSAQELARAIRETMADPANARRAAAALRRHVRQELDVDANAAKLVEVYHRAAHMHGRRSDKAAARTPA